MIPVLLRMQVRFEQLLQSKPDAVGNSAMPTLLKVLLRAGSPPSRTLTQAECLFLSVCLTERTLETEGSKGWRVIPLLETLLHA